MLDKDQIRNPAPNFNRLFSRRSSTIRLTLVTLFIGTIIWIMILKPLAESDTLTKILVWNNNNKTRIYSKDFKLNNSDVELNVFNSEENLHDLSKYTTCSMAKYDYCYFQDDDWLNLYMDSLYTNFLENPNLIHSNSMPVIYLESRRWMFANVDKNLHTGFTWLGCGSFVSRAKVQRFLGQLGSISLIKDRLKLADRYFTLWTNQYPYQLSNPLTPLDQKDGWGVDQWNMVYNNILDATQKLYTALAVKSNSEFFAREEEKPYYNDRIIRAPCLNDKCLFLTNIDPFPHPSRVYYANNITHVRDQESKFNKLDFPSKFFWNNYAYHYAVDSDEKTCWNSFKIPKIEILDASFYIRVSSGGNRWRTCNITSSNNTDHKNRNTFEFDCSNTVKNKQLIRFIRIEASRDFLEPFEICSLILDELNV
ncbi:unnamed protein product [Rhizophagus irregularis]|nr:unnamed protein product [Rhizophagus irregularis]